MPTRTARPTLLPVYGIGGPRHPDYAIGFAASLTQATRLATAHNTDNALIRHHGFSLTVGQPDDFAALDRDAKQPYYVFCVSKTVASAKWS